MAYKKMIGMHSAYRIAQFATILALCTAVEPAVGAEDVMRVGIVGCDTSHVIVYTDLINDPRATGALAKIQVTAAFPGGSDDLPASRDRLPTYVQQLRDKGIAIVDSLAELADQSDAVLLESVDGRKHLEQFRAVAQGKPVFVDKPMAASLADVIAIFRIADVTNTPIFSSSALRFCDSVQTLANDRDIGELIGCDTAGPMSIDPHHPDLFWYGIHGVESLFTILGTGCESVSRSDTELSSVVVGKWRDGRLGSYRGLKKGKANYAFVAYGNNHINYQAGFSGYGPTAVEIGRFFVTRTPPVSREETIEIFAFMEAADESKRLGQTVAIRDIIRRAEQAADSVSAEVNP